MVAVTHWARVCSVGCQVAVCYITPNTTHMCPVDLTPSQKLATIASQGHTINKNSHKKYYKILENFSIVRKILTFLEQHE
jgi:hypothetical protein